MIEPAESEPEAEVFDVTDLPVFWQVFVRLGTLLIDLFLWLTHPKLPRFV